MQVSTRRGVTALLAGGALAALAGPAPAQPQQLRLDLPDPEAEPGSTQVATGRDKVSRITAPVTIDGRGPFDFLVDTGANRSCISQKLAESLQLASGPQMSVHTVVGQSVRRSVFIGRLEVGGRNLLRVKAPVLPIREPDTDGVLGIDWLKGQRLVLDFRRQTLAIERSRAERAEEGRVIVPARRRAGQLTIIDAEMGTTRISAMVDSGASISIGNAALLALVEADNLRFQRKFERVEMTSLAGETFTGSLYYLPFVRLGGLQLGNVPVVFANVHVFNLWKMQNTPSLLLGMDLLSEFDAVALDFGRSTVRFDLRA